LLRYYFHIRDGWNVIPDEEGMELPNFDAARTEAYASADDLSRAAIRDGSNVSACAIEITDDVGNILGRVKVLVQRRLD
jgi:hypothetical protein